jgi:hypothetical protein
MVNWDEIKGKLSGIGDKAKESFAVLSDKTQKSARAASLKVKIVMEENKINKAMGELGKKVFDLMERSETNLVNNPQVKDIVKVIKDSKQSIANIREEIKKA